MQWSWFGLRPSLELAWSFDAGGIVWRLVPSATGQILGEERRNEGKRASFFCLDEASGTTLWRDREFDEPWWIGIEAVAGGIAILHTYEKPDMPQHREMIAIDLRSGREIWREADAAFWFLSGTSVYGVRQQLGPRTVSELDLKSGKRIRSLDEGLPELGDLRKNADDSIQTGDISLPCPHVEGSDPDVDRILGRSILRTQGTTGVESLRLNDYLLVSFFIPTAGGEARQPEFVNRFRVIDLRNGRTLHDEVLAGAVPAPVPDTFYVRKGVVVSVRDLTSVRAHRLYHQMPDGAPPMTDTRSTR